MRGRHQIIVSNVRIQYKFYVERNITILQGVSATGKSTLIQMIAEYQEKGKQSGITVQSDKPCFVLAGLKWERDLADIHDSIVFIDEGQRFVSSTDFAQAVQGSDNDYVIATRIPLAALPYSVREIYGIKNTTRRRRPGFERLYAEFYHLIEQEDRFVSFPDLVVVEDTNAGFEFFQHYFSQYGIRCVSAGGKSNVFGLLVRESFQTALIIADGAAFGLEIQRLNGLKLAKNLILFMPESFEWPVLKSGMINDREIEAILDAPSKHIDGHEYFSWERFFTALLTERSRGTYLEYSKRRLNPNYLQSGVLSRITGSLPEPILNELKHRE